MRRWTARRCGGGARPRGHATVFPEQWGTRSSSCRAMQAARSNATCLAAHFPTPGGNAPRTPAAPATERSLPLLRRPRYACRRPRSRPAEGAARLRPAGDDGRGGRPAPAGARPAAAAGQPQPGESGGGQVIGRAGGRALAEGGPARCRAVAPCCLLSLHCSVAGPGCCGASLCPAFHASRACRLPACRPLAAACRGGQTITQIRAESGAGVKVLLPHQLPPCALANDLLVEVGAGQGQARCPSLRLPYSCPCARCVLGAGGDAEYHKGSVRAQGLLLRAPNSANPLLICRA